MPAALPSAAPPRPENQNRYEKSGLARCLRPRHSLAYVEHLYADHPFWRHPRIVVTPHVAAFTNPATAAPIILDNIRRFEEGRPLLKRVDPARGY